MQLAELIEPMAELALSLTRETWSSVWPEAKPLAEAHARELGHETLRLNEALMAAGCAMGSLQIYGMRAESGLVGYICWQLSPDPEQSGRKLATQGPWYVKLEWRGHGRELFLFSLAEVKALGAWKALPHREFSRNGEALGAWFESIGARPRLVEYELMLVEE